MNSEADEVKIKDLQNYADNIITSTRLQKTPRHTTIDLAYLATNENEIGVSHIHPHTNSQIHAENFEVESNNQQSFRSSNHQEPVIANNRISNKNLNATSRLYSGKSSSSSNQINSRNESQNSSRAPTPPVYLTHVTLSLTLPKTYRPTTSSNSPLWKYTSIRKNTPPSTENINEIKNRRYSPGNGFFLSSSNYLDKEDDFFDEENFAVPKKFHRPTTVQQKSSKNSSSRKHEKAETNNDENNDEVVDKPVEQTKVQHDPNCEFYNSDSATPNLIIERSPSSIIQSISKPKKNLRTSSHKSNLTDISILTKSSMNSLLRSHLSGRYSMNVSEFNRFKSNLLKNHLRSNYTDEPEAYCSSNSYEGSSFYANGTRPKIVRPAASTEHKVSKIKSIYEQLNHHNNLRVYSVDTKRSNYLKNIERAHSFLSSSLSIKKL